MSKKSILFVCLGNICRSPMAEGMFIHQLKDQGKSDNYLVDSAGTGNYHVGETPDTRMTRTATNHGVSLPSIARQVTESDFRNFDYIIAMDDSNVRNLMMVKPNDATAQMFKMRDFDTLGKGEDVPDPYFGGEEGFEEVFAISERSCLGLIEYLENN